MIYGYARISTNKQNIERQNRNILEQYPFICFSMFLNDRLFTYHFYHM